MKQNNLGSLKYIIQNILYRKITATLKQKNHLSLIFKGLQFLNSKYQERLFKEIKIYTRIVQKKFINHFKGISPPYYSLKYTSQNKEHKTTLIFEKLF